MANIEHVSEDTMDALFVARELWKRKDYIVTARVMASVGIDEALDQMNAEIEAGIRFEEVFGGGV